MMATASGAQWDRTVAELCREFDDLSDWRLAVSEQSIEQLWDLYLVVRSTRLLRIGDVLPVVYWNGGGQRQPITAVTGRGYVLRHYYVRYRAYRGNDGNGSPAGPVRIVEPPGELVGLPPTAPAVRRFVVETLCGGDAGCPATALRRAL